MHLVYIDEVKHQPDIEPYYLLCGLAIDEQDIASIEDALNLISKEYFGESLLGQVTEFHASHILHGKGNCKGHEISQRINLFKQLADVISSHGGIGRIVIRLDPSKMMSQDYQRMAFMYLVERVESLMTKRQSIALLISDHDKEFLSANVRNLSTYKETGTNYEYGRDIRCVVDTIHHTKSHHSRLIQLADLYVYSRSILYKNNTDYPKITLVEYMSKLPNYYSPTKYIFWP